MGVLDSTNGQTIGVYWIVTWALTTILPPIVDLISKIIDESEVVVCVYTNLYMS
jgi:hypothetical protein